MKLHKMGTKIILAFTVLCICSFDTYAAEEQFIGSFSGSNNVQSAETSLTVGENAADKTTQLNQLTGIETADLSMAADILNDSTVQWGAYLLDVTERVGYDIGNGNTKMSASALIGVPVLFTLADGFKNGTISVETTAPFYFTFEGGRGNLKAEQSGDLFSVLYLMQEALIYSDNNALNSLIDYLGIDKINSVCHEYGYSSVDIQRKLISEQSPLDNYISAEDASMMLNAIYQNNFNVINREFLLNYFAITTADTSNAGMVKVGQNYNIFLNLNGYTENRYNEIGLFSDGDKMLILTVLTSDADGDFLMNVVSDLTLNIVPGFFA